jgi:hypothetical protein
MNKALLFLFSACIMLLFSNAGCSRKTVENHSALKKLYEKYKFGQIEECTYEGKKVYHAGINAFDAGSQVYDEEGRSIATCNYATRMVDPPCKSLQDCEAVYRCDKHISGEPAVDKYGLGK